MAEITTAPQRSKNTGPRSAGGQPRSVEVEEFAGVVAHPRDRRDGAGQDDAVCHGNFHHGTGKRPRDAAETLL